MEQSRWEGVDSEEHVLGWGWGINNTVKKYLLLLDGMRLIVLTYTEEATLAAIREARRSRKTNCSDPGKRWCQGGLAVEAKK